MIANHLMPRMIRFAIHSRNLRNAMDQMAIRLGNVDFSLDRGVLVMSIPTDQWRRKEVEHDLMDTIRNCSAEKRAGVLEGYRIRQIDGEWRCEGAENWANRSRTNEIIVFPEYCKTEQQAWAFLAIERGLQPISIEHLVAKFVQDFKEEANQLSRSSSLRYA